MNDINVTNNPGAVNHTLFNRDTFTHRVTIKRNGVAVDLAGSTFYMKLVDNRGEVLHELELGTGIEIIDEAGGIVEYTLTSTQVNALATGCRLPYFFEWTDADSVVKTLEKGFFYKSIL